MHLSLAAAMAIALIGVILLLMRRPEILAEPRGRLLGVLVFSLLPMLVTWNGFNQHLENSKSTSFCLSCHVMQPYGRSLYFDSPEYLPAAHFQNRRIPREQACYTCHTSYTMYGGVHSKVRGFRHLLVQVVGPPEKIRLYEPFQNRECLHCHWGARSFAENPVHAESLEALRSDQVSCLVCHSQTHHPAGAEAPPLWGDREGARG